MAGWAVYLIPGNVQIVRQESVPDGRAKIVTQTFGGRGGGIWGQGYEADRQVACRTAIRDGIEVRGLSYDQLTPHDRLMYRIEMTARIPTTRVSAHSGGTGGTVGWDITFPSDGGAPSLLCLDLSTNVPSEFRWPFNVDGTPASDARMPDFSDVDSILRPWVATPAPVATHPYTFEPDRPQE